MARQDNLQYGSREWETYIHELTPQQICAVFDKFTRPNAPEYEDRIAAFHKKHNLGTLQIARPARQYDIMSARIVALDDGDEHDTISEARAFFASIRGGWKRINQEKTYLGSLYRRYSRTL